MISDAVIHILHGEAMNSDVVTGRELMILIEFTLSQTHDTK